MNRLLRRAFDAKAREIGVTCVQWQVLMALLRHEGIGQSQLAQMFAVEPISVSRLVMRLETTDLISREAHPTDRRARCLFLTAKAKRLLEILSPLAQECLDKAYAGLSVQEIEFLFDKLCVVRSNLQDARIRFGEGAGTAGSQVSP
ncbi:MAG: MarR family winged helix-turn-helix transcriptional regulator [Azoarcus sp.]|nr:MarR family winged helix-turn-helix transcriptional regulator [Azoarcus sp.]